VRRQGVGSRFRKARPDPRVAILTGFAFLAAAHLTSAPARLQAPPLHVETISGVTFTTLPDFRVERVVPADQTDSYVVLTFDAAGQPVVAKEGDTPRRLRDLDGDGVYETRQVLTDQVKNCQGLWFDGPVLYGSCSTAGDVGPNPRTNTPAALFRLTDADGDGFYESAEAFLAIDGRIQEHGPHAIRRGPDGRPWLISGNFAAAAPAALARIPASDILPNVQLLPTIESWQPSRQPELHSALYQIDLARRAWLLHSGGNRNAYDFAFTLDGEAFTFDSDMEWDINLPWYRPIRTVHAVPGGHYGYQDDTGKYPTSYLDSLPPIREEGRGSPVGVETYQSYVYPASYFDSLFEADWIIGRLLYSAVTPDGASFRLRNDDAEIMHGNPLLMIDIEVGPDGMIWFTSGGRFTQGAVWRLRYVGPPQPEPDRSGILGVVRQPQPLSSWGWAAIETARATMGPAFQSSLEQLALTAGANPTDRMRALLELQRHAGGPDRSVLQMLQSDSNATVRATVMYLTGLAAGSAAHDEMVSIAAAGLVDPDARVRRRAAEALVALGQSPTAASLAPVDNIYALVADSDRWVRWAGRRLLELTPRHLWAVRALRDDNPTAAFAALLAWVRTAGSSSLRPALDRESDWLRRRDLAPADQVRLLRLLAYTLAVGPEALSEKQAWRLHFELMGRFPSGDERVDREMALFLAYLGRPGVVTRLLDALPPDDSNQPLQIEYMYALRTVRAGWSDADRARANAWLQKSSTWRGGNEFGHVMDELSAELRQAMQQP